MAPEARQVEGLLRRITASARRTRCSRRPGRGRRRVSTSSSARPRRTVERRPRRSREGMERLPREVEHRGVIPSSEVRPGRRTRPQARHPSARRAGPHQCARIRHAKRWQDVEELLDAGINVYTTLNVQHLESLNDVVDQVTGVKVRETVPDRVLDGADEIELVDLPPEDLLSASRRQGLPAGAGPSVRTSSARATSGPAGAGAAADRRAGRCGVQDYRREHGIAPTWPVSERILVCVRPSRRASA